MIVDIQFGLLKIHVHNFLLRQSFNPKARPHALNFYRQLNNPFSSILATLGPYFLHPREFNQPIFWSFWLLLRAWHLLFLFCRLYHSGYWLLWNWRRIQGCTSMHPFGNHVWWKNQLCILGSISSNWQSQHHNCWQILLWEYHLCPAHQRFWTCYYATLNPMLSTFQVNYLLAWSFFGLSRISHVAFRVL